MKKLIVLLIVCGGLGYGGWWLWESRAPDAAQERRAVHTVTRGDLIVSVTEGGSIEAVKEKIISNQVQGNSQIIFLIDEGTSVKAGQLLVELDSSDLMERTSQQEINYQNALNAFKKSQEDLSIQKSVNDSNRREGELSVEFARIDLEKYRDGDWPQTRKKAESDITIAEAELKRAQDRLTWTEKLQASGYATRSELDADKLTVKRSELEYEQKKEAFRLLEKYEYPQRLKKLEADVLKKSEELQRVNSRAAAALAQAEADLNSRAATLELQQTKLERFQEQLELTKIRAPQDGMVVYASSSSRRGSSNQITEGATVRQRQDLIKLPDTSRMKVAIKVHESRMNQVMQGQTAYIIVDALPDQRFHGVVSKIGILPDAQSSWLNPDLKVYSTDIIIDGGLPDDVKPGLSARAEIIIAKLDQVLTVPIQCVTVSGKRQVVYVVRDGMPIPEAVRVTAGLFNETHIEIKEGLKEGDVVLLNPPAPDKTPNMGVRVIPPDKVTREDATPKKVDSIEDDKDDGAGDIAASADAQLAGILQRLPEDKRDAFRQRWGSMDASQRKELLSKMKAGRQKDAAP